MKQLEALIAWTPTHWEDVKPDTVGKVVVVPFPDETGLSNLYAMTGGACYADQHSAPEWQRLAMLFIDFNTIVVRDGINPQEAHRAFIAIDEYRLKIAPDQQGATKA
ncbi:hypothetical protein [Methylobacterium sp. E-046]|uniref:hypothetical protein n=1 Tax=Methylobacterium sp. E-046 TaxID=2836576 RepID=UPI001FBB7FF8|nr:hypothetical protein [Methylobacterium sp. E-046]MCJ2098442.1 hypothetical protein [Methylobacterium sp. E-046]